MTYTILLDSQSQITCNAVQVGGDMWILDSPVYNDPTRDFVGREIPCTAGEATYTTYKFGRQQGTPIQTTLSYKIDNYGDGPMTNGIQQIDNVYFICVGVNTWVQRFDLSSDDLTTWAANANSYNDYLLGQSLSGTGDYSLLSSPFTDEQTVLGDASGVDIPDGSITVNNRQYSQVDGGYICDDDLMKGLSPLPTGNDNGAKIPVLTYHEFSDTVDTQYDLDINKFRDDMEWLHNNGWYTLTETEAINILTTGAAVPDNAVLITLDDFYPSWIGEGDSNLNAIQIMEDNGINAILFITTDNVDDAAWTVLRNLDHNQFALGAHNVKHIADNSLSYGDLQDQINTSKSTIESQGQTSVRSYAYPTGSRNSESLLALRKAGFSMAFNFGFEPANTAGLVIMEPATRLTESSTDGTLARFNFNRKEIHPQNAYNLPYELTSDDTVSYKKPQNS
ncbi:hypothetical protein FC83_GL002722 [Agrilactobacillus composti DSM 18527 = JCM 14202]|uniref:NodB homology domain-containing protein n=2 Tax=Agrilactobacillus TaxID=2767875 RepID=A0A0R1YBJ2_9LACO|nr:hypothetical protein FC83_GL002722 [Agrilactobacillus composti DSM 18527 = JCM 14202]